MQELGWRPIFDWLTTRCSSQPDLPLIFVDQRLRFAGMWPSLEFLLVEIILSGVATFEIGVGDFPTATSFGFFPL